MNFNGRTETKKGTLGERIAERLLVKHGYSVYRPADLENAHPIDRIAVCKRTLCVLLCDVKSKPKRVLYPDTGIDMRHYVTYITMANSHRMKVYLVFVDEDEGIIYGNFLDILDRTKQIQHNGRLIYYPKTENTGRDEIRYFPISSMQIIGDLEPEEKAELQALSTRHKQYSDIASNREPTFQF